MLFVTFSGQKVEERVYLRFGTIRYICSPCVGDEDPWSYRKNVYIQEVIDHVHVLINWKGPCNPIDVASE